VETKDHPLLIHIFRVKDEGPYKPYLKNLETELGQGRRSFVGEEEGLRSKTRGGIKKWKETVGPGGRERGLLGRGSAKKCPKWGVNPYSGRGGVSTNTQTRLIRSLNYLTRPQSDVSRRQTSRLERWLFGEKKNGQKLYRGRYEKP